MIDMAQLREDYRNGMTVRDLSKKYNVPKSTVGDWIKKYGWTQEVKIKKIIMKADSPDKKVSGQESKPDKKTSGQADKPDGPEISLEDYTVLRSYVMKILAKADQLLEIDDALAPRDLKSLTSMLMDARVLLGALSPAEKREQELKTEKLRNEAKSTQTDGKREVTFNIIGMSQDEIEEVLG